MCFRGWPAAASGCTENAWAPHDGCWDALAAGSWALPGRGSASEGPVHPGPKADECDVGRGCQAMIAY